MVKEGDKWLKLLAEVLKGTATISPSAAAAAEVESAEKASSSPTADSTTSRRTSTRAGRGVRKPMFMDADFDTKIKVNECPPPKRMENIFAASSRCVGGSIGLCLQLRIPT